MLNLFKPMTAIGWEASATQIKGAKVALIKGQPHLEQLIDLPNEPISHVKPLYIDHPFVVTGLEGTQVLVRSLFLPLIKIKDIEATLPFQVEPLIPYPADQAILAYQILSQNGEGTHLTLFAVRKDLLQNHLEQWQARQIEPEKIGSFQSALCQFGSFYISNEKPYLILHLSEKQTTCLLIKDKKLIAAYTQPEGLELLPVLFNDETLVENEGIKRLQQVVAKIVYALSKENKGEIGEGILITGEAARFSNFVHMLTEKLNLPLLTCSNTDDKILSQQKQVYAIPIGLAIEALVKGGTNFRQHEFSYPRPWKRIKLPLLAYLALILTLTFSFYLFGQFYLSNKENALKQDYVDLLAAMGKSYEGFEENFLAKNPLAREKSEGEVVNVTRLQKEDLLKRLEFLQKDLQATPDSFPLFANIPRVSDVLAWLSNHLYVVNKKEDGILEPRLQLENFSYSMLKRPLQGKKQEKYQVKIELEFSSSTPKWAREFHDALIAPNDLVDPKGEVKWSSNRGRYRTSFYLKDKTAYPG